ncbi:MAG: hypothetical protein PHE27_01995 [Alphaproteobacteria bacterium]|nr:hypothetical protein [Alphaproteobacteria bacterium]
MSEQKNNLYELMQAYKGDLLNIGYSEQQSDSAVRTAFHQATREFSTRRSRTCGAGAMGGIWITGLLAMFKFSQWADTIDTTEPRIEFVKTVAGMAIFGVTILGGIDAFRKINARLFADPFYRNQFDERGNPDPEGDESLPVYDRAKDILARQYGVARVKPSKRPAGDGPECG